MTQAHPTEPSRERGVVTWLSSGPDAGPDVGLAIGLGAGHSLYIGELSDSLIREVGIDPEDFAGTGWWLALDEGGAFRIIGPVADAEAVHALADVLGSALRIAGALSNGAA